MRNPSAWVVELTLPMIQAAVVPLRPLLGPQADDVAALTSNNKG